MFNSLNVVDPKRLIFRIYGVDLWGICLPDVLRGTRIHPLDMHLLVTQVGKNRPYVLRDIKRICKVLKFKMKTELLGFGYLIIVLQMPLRMVFSDQQSIISSRIFLS